MTTNYVPPPQLVEDLESVLDTATLRHYESNADETFQSCELCGEWEGHTPVCPIPAIEAFLSEPPPPPPPCVFCGSADHVVRDCAEIWREDADFEAVELGQVTYLPFDGTEAS